MAGATNPQSVAVPTSLAPAPMRPQPQPIAAPPVTGAQPVNMNTPAGPNVFNQAAGAYNTALGAAGGAARFSGSPVGTQFGYTADQVSADPAYAGMANYFNPWTQQVIDGSLADLEQQRQMQMNQMGAAAGAAGAFGGSRHGVAEALTNTGFGQQAGQLASGLRMQGFNTALGASQADAMARLQAGMANQGANARAQEFGQSSRLQAQIANQQAAAAAAQVRLGAAGQLGNLSSLGFNMGNTITQQQMQQGAMQQALMQSLIDASRGQYQGFTGAPAQSLQLPLAAVGASNMGQQTQTTKNNPGLLGILGTGASIIGSICWVAREVYGEEDPRWTEFRHWLLTAAPKWLLDAYVKHGEAFARVVRKVPLLKRLLRPLMDRARRAAGFAG
jgi:hypothetical protein